MMENIMKNDDSLDDPLKDKYTVSCPLFYDIDDDDDDDDDGFMINLVKESDDGSYSVVLGIEDELPELKDPDVLHYKIDHNEEEFQGVLNKAKSNDDSPNCENVKKEKNIISGIDEMLNDCSDSKNDYERRNIIADNYTGSYIKNELVDKKKSKERSYCCPIGNCKRSFFHIGTFRQHQILHGIKQFKCKFCGKVTPDFDRLKLHESKHLNDDGNIILYHCIAPKCNKSFCSLSLLRQHELSHTEDSHPYVCEICDKRFKTKRHRISHSQSHMSSRTYSCSDCGKCFKHLAALNQHVRGHRSLGKFVCNLCGAEFNKPGNYNRHKQIHKSKKYICKVCKSSYNYLSSLTKHMIKAHPIAKSKEAQMPPEIRKRKNIISYLQKLRSRFKT